MEVGPHEFQYFWPWLLGPSWHEGALFASPVLLAVVLVILGGGGLLLLLHAGRSPSATRWLARGLLVGGGLVTLAALLVALWSITPDGFLLFRWYRAGIGAVVWFVGGAVGLLLGPGWYLGGLFHGLLVMTVVSFVLVAIGWLVATLRNGPRAGLRKTDEVLANGLGDLLAVSPRRLAALARLTVKESIRKRAIVVFAIFVLLLLFAGWFLDPGSTHPGQLYLSFVLTSTSYLVLLLALFLSALSLPADINNRTLQTVVTKPVRRSEIVIGRMLGFAVLGTVLLAVMGTISYAFVVRGLAHRHEIPAASLELDDQMLAKQAASGRAASVRIELSRVHNHRHTVALSTAALLDAKPEVGQETPWARARTDATRDHWHEITYRFVREQDEAGKQFWRIEYRVGPPQGMLVARVPMYGKLRFKDRSGKDAEKGYNVGDEWTYRSYIEGGTASAAIWTFEGVTPEKFPNGLPIEMTINVFRTYKGDITKGIVGSLTIRNPRTGLSREAKIFTAKEFTTDSQFIPRKLPKVAGAVAGQAKAGEIDLFDELVDDGKVEIWLRCVEPQQYFGMARADLYLRKSDASFVLNFAKGYVGIWLQMLLVVGFGVMFSTFLSGPIAMLATAGVLVGGTFIDFVQKLAAHQVYGGGPIESFIRLLRQDNVTTPMEPGVRTTLTLMGDRVLEIQLWVISRFLPPFADFSYADAVADGRNVMAALVARCFVQALAFLIPVAVAAYFFLKTREVAQ